jgi:hypothetical protein
MVDSGNHLVDLLYIFLVLFALLGITAAITLLVYGLFFKKK